MFYLILGVSIGFIFFLIHHTDFIYSYSQLLGLQKYFINYKNWKHKTDSYGNLPNMDFYLPVFIRETWRGGRFVTWLSYLIGCPICSISFVCFFTGFPFYGFFMGFFGVFCYLILAILYKKLNSLFSV